jgi:spectinomycin phosphotransferase
MLESPCIPDELIISSLKAEYNLDVNHVTFLPLGLDVNTAVYRLEDRMGTAYFLKLRKGDFHPITVEIPHFLSGLGVRTVLSPIETHTNQLFGSFEDYTTILYPFIPGKDGYELKLSEQHWVELGWTLRRVHTAEIPVSLVSHLPHETYDPQWRVNVKRFQVLIDTIHFNEPVARELSAFMKAKHLEINHLVGRAEELAFELKKSSTDFVLCHSDAHPGNYLIAESGELYLVDWDNPIFAPKERDLMYFGSGMAGDQPGGMEERSFYQGYGQVKVNLKALAYYRYERIVQDIAEFCKQLFLTTEGGDDREQAYKFFTSSFLPGNVLDVAVETDRHSKTAT